jgi:hypothetical protein
MHRGSFAANLALFRGWHEMAKEIDMGDRAASRMTIEEFLSWQTDQEDRYEFGGTSVWDDTHTI